MKRRMHYSKILPIISGSMFILCLMFGLLATVTNAFDTTVFVTAISVSGAIWGSNIVWYNKKAQSENIYKLKISMYKYATDERLRFNEEMLKLRKEYNVDENVIYDIENDGDIDEMTSSALSNAISSLDSMENESMSPDQITTFNL